MPVKINGLPAHVLLVHAVVVLVPLAALALVLHAAWPAARRRLGVVTPGLAFVALVLVPVTTHAGEWLQSRLPDNPAIRRHVQLGHDLLPWAGALFLLSVVAWVLGRRYELAWRPAPGGRATPSTRNDDAAPAGDGAVATLARPEVDTARRELPVWVTAALTVVSAAVAVVTVIVLYRIGDSGAHAVWGPIANLPAR